MELMTTSLTRSDVAIRLALAVLAGSMMGFDRGESGKVAGLRTTLLVCLAACLAMLQVNALLAQAGKPTGSLVELDLMRLPLGILSGVGFIGAGAILRKDGLVLGVTTAATLWFVTVIGLCIGGGQITLALAGLALGVIVLWALKVVEGRLPRKQTALLTIEYDRATGCGKQLTNLLVQKGLRVVTERYQVKADSGICEEQIRIVWQGSFRDPKPPPFADFALEAGAASVCWALDR